MILSISSCLYISVESNYWWVWWWSFLEFRWVSVENKEIKVKRILIFYKNYRIDEIFWKSCSILPSDGSAYNCPVECVSFIIFEEEYNTISPICNKMKNWGFVVFLTLLFLVKCLWFFLFVLFLRLLSRFKFTSHSFTQKAMQHISSTSFL